MALTHVLTQLPTAFIDKAYRADLQAAGGTPPYTFSLASVNPLEGLPAGLSLVGSSIVGTVIDDTLVKKGYTVRIRVADATGTTVDYIYPLRVRIQTTKVDYKLDEEIEDTYYGSQHLDPTFQLHLLLAKLLYFGVDNADEELTPAEATLVRNWTDVSTSVVADVDLNTVLSDLRGWTNDIAYPEFENVTAVVAGPGPQEVTVTITSANQDIFVGTTLADYTQYFLLVSPTYLSYVSLDNSVFKVKTVTPTAPVNGLTTSVDLVCAFDPNPSAIAAPTTPFYCVYSKSAELRDIPATTVNSLFKLITGVLESVTTTGLQKINSVGPSTTGTLVMTSAQSSIFENAAHNTIGVNSPTAGTFNNKSVPGINIKGHGISSVSANQRSELLIPKINSVSDLDSFSVSKREITTELANTIAIETQNILMADARDSIKLDQSSNTHLINDRYYRGTPAPLPAYTPFTRGDTKASYDGRVLDPTNDALQVLFRGLSWNQVDHPTQVGRVAITQAPAYGALIWPRTMANEIHSTEYVDRVIGQNQIQLAKALFWLSPFIRTPLSYDLAMTYWDDGTSAWVTTVLASYDGTVPVWSYSAPAATWGKVEYYDDDGVGVGIGAEVTVVTAAGTYSLNAGYEITNVANFIAAIGGKSKLVVFHVGTPVAGTPYTEYSNPTYVFIEVTTAATLSAFAFTSLPDPISVSGVEYYSGDALANFTMTVTGLGTAIADGVTPITRDYPIEFLSLTHGSTWLPATTSIVTTAAQLDVAHLGNNIAMQDFLKDSGYTDQSTPSVSYANIIEVWAGGGQRILDIRPSDATLVLGTTYPIMKTTANGNLTHELTAAFNNDEKTELFVDEHYRASPSDHNAFDQYIKPMQPNVGRTNLWGWRGDVSLPVGSLEVGTFVNPGVTDTFTIGTRKYYDGSYFIPGLRMPQEDYTTTRAAYPGTNYDYSARTADGYYYRVFNLGKPTTNLDAIKVYGFYNGTAIDVVHLTAVGVLLEISVKVPGPDGYAWLDITGGTLSNITFGGTTVGVQSANLGLIGNTVDGNHLLVVRIKITNDTPGVNCNKYVITGLEVE